MKSFYIAKSLLFLGSALIFINLLEVSQTHLFSLDTLVQFGLLMITLELAFKIVCPKSSLKKHKSANTNNTQNNTQNYSFVLSKVGVSSVLIGFLLQTLTI